MSSTLPSNVPDFEAAKPPRKERPPIGGIVITVILAIALIAIIGVAITRLSSGSLGRPTAATAPTRAASAAQTASPAQATAAAGSPADAATAQAIQQVIQQVDQAQAQAIANNDPSGMSAAATSEFYQEQVATNQDLVDGGVTDIELKNIEWGPIIVNGDTATRDELRDVVDDVQRRHHGAVARSERVYAGARQRHVEGAGRRSPGRVADTDGARLLGRALTTRATG